MAFGLNGSKYTKADS